MAGKHPTHGKVVTLRVDARHAPFLRDHLEAGIAGTLEQLAEAPERLRDPVGSRAYADTFQRIIDGIDRGEIVADAEVRAVLIEQAAINDDANDFEQALAEHEAFAHLLRQLGLRQLGGVAL